MDRWVRVVDESGPKSNAYSQTINLNGIEDKQGIPLIGKDVTVNTSGGIHNHGSSKVKLTNIVDYNWEPKLHLGQLIAVHMTGKYFAYGIKVQKAAQNIGLVRVASPDSEERALLRGMKGQIQDIAFAFIPNQYILGCVDEEGTLFVHNVDIEGKNIVCTLLLHIVHSPDPAVSVYHRILWCPYMPEDDPEVETTTEDDGAKLLVLTHGCKAEMWNVSQVCNHHGSGPHNPSQIEQGFLEINEHTLPIIDAAFSPDGTALATASLDGDVKFFQVYMHISDSKPRCLHQWKPHAGKALSCLFFLDDHNTYTPDVQFWKFAITGCDNNTELKLWSCESWTCLQTIYFKSDPARPLTPGRTSICLKAGLDNSASYLLLSDIQNKILFVLQIHKDLNANAHESTAKIEMISEFFLQSPILSFGIVNAGVRKLKCSASTEDLYQLQDGLEIDDGNLVAVLIRMYIVQPKSLQECRIVYQPNLNADILNESSGAVETNMRYRDETNCELESSKSALDNSDLINIPDEYTTTKASLIPPQASKTDQQLNLMTPDSFNSPVQHATSVNTTAADLAASESSLNEANHASVENKLNGTDNDDDLIVFQRNNNFASGGSSPSREVQEILSTYPNECYEESNDANYDEVSDETKINSQVANLISDSNFVENDDIEWTKIPIMKVNEVIKSEEGRIVDSLPPAPGAPVISTSQPLSVANHQMSDTEHDSASHLVENQKSIFKKVMSQKMICLEEQMQQLVALMENLQHQVTGLNRNAAAIQQPVVTSAPSPTSTAEMHFNQLSTLISSQIDGLFTKHMAEQKTMLENWMVTRVNKEREYQETLLSAVSQLITNNILDKLDTVVTQEIQKNVLPQIVNCLELLKRQLHAEMTQKLTTTDHLLKENITKLVHSKSVMEILGTSVVTALRPHIDTSYKEMLTNSILPSWERVCQTMFQQIHDTFAQGTKEYVMCLETHLDKQRRGQEKGRDIVTQLQGVSDAMRTNSEHLASSLSSEIQQQVQRICTNFQETMKKTVRQEVKEQIDRSFRNHAAVLEDSVLNAVKSRAVTPSPQILDTQVQQNQIQQLLAQNQINAAFQLALSASDLSLVVYTCEKVNPKQIFNQTPCPLQQNVLLSLIQQLSADMSNHTEIKIKYLEMAVMELQTKNPLTREHMPIVIKELQRQLNTYIDCNPNNANSRQMKLLLMATRSLI